ncbi:hypothetical protein QQP08_001800 [Theobroma cacao]|nr:hypothetical protein QQP08_001800 [Theobroma cacao]
MPKTDQKRAGLVSLGELLRHGHLLFGPKFRTLRPTPTKPAGALCPFPPVQAPVQFPSIANN